MRRRILVAILAVTTLAVALFGVPLAVVIERFVNERAVLNLEREAVLAARTVPADFASRADPVELPAIEAISFGLYDTAGHRIAGVGPPSADAVVNAALGNRVVELDSSGSQATAIPLLADEHVIGVLRATQPNSSTQGRALHSIVLLAALGAAVLTVGAGVGSVVARRLTRPISRLRDDAVRLGSGDFRLEPINSGVPELDDTSEALSVTARTLDDLVSRERAFSADASHQLRTPLAAIRILVETEITFPADDRDQVLSLVLEDVARLEETIEVLLTHARTSTVQLAEVDIDSLLEDLKQRWNGPLARLGRPLVVRVPASVPTAVGVESLLREGLDNIVDNAVRHGAGEVRVEVRVTDESVTMTVRDEGPGLTGSVNNPAPAELHGFGLPVAKRLIDASHGRLVITNDGPKPSFDIVLSRTPPQEAQKRTTPP